MKDREKHFLLTGAVAVLLSGCTSGGTSAVPASVDTAVRAAEQRTVAPAHNGGVLYVSDYERDEILVFSSSERAGNTSPIATYSVGATPQGLWVDRKGVLYAVVGDVVEEFKRGNSMPFLTLSTGMRHPISVAVDAKRTVYVNDEEVTNAAIVEYRAGQTSPSRTITLTVSGAKFSFAGGMAFDTSGNLYASEFFYPINPAHVYRIKRGTSNVKDLGLTGVGNEAGVGVDDRGTLYVGAETFGINVYPAGSSSPTETIPLDTQSTSLFAVTPKGAIYAPLQYGASSGVAEFAPNGKTPTNTLSGSYFSEPIGDALDAESLR
ncbi:MAG: hypothetical protein WB615_16670 [Candidatus Tumulicola sp.]